MIPGADRAMRCLLETHRTEDRRQFKLPLVLLTNAGGKLEHKWTDMINETLFGTAPSPNEPVVKPEQMILSHTPLKQMLPKYGDKFVLVSGMHEAVDVCVEYGFKKAMHAEEVLALIPEICGVARRYPESTLI